MQQIGVTSENKKIMGGVFKFYDTYGLPLSIVFDVLISKNMIPSWIHFIMDAKKSGWKKRTVDSRVREAIIDTYGLIFWVSMEEKWCKSLDMIFWEDI